MSLSVENEAPQLPHPSVTPDAHAQRLLTVTLKQLVKADAAVIRSAKRGTHALQRAGLPEAARAQAGLAALRQDARATLLLYGLARGRALDLLERGRQALDWRAEIRLQGAWQRARDAVTRITGIEPAVPDALRPHLPRGTA